MIIDIIKAIHEGEISLDEAYDIFDSIIEDKDGNYKDGEEIPILELTGMDNYEYTAFCQGAGLEDLVKWRYEGWPNVCARTGRKFDYKKYGWLVKEIGGETKLILLDN